MTAIAHPSVLASVLAGLLFAAAMLHVVVTDLRSRRIRNWLVAALAGTYLPLGLAAGLPAAGMAAAAGAAMLVFAAGFGCFAAGWIGGGDAKLAPVCVLWLGADQALSFLALASIIGGIMALALLAGCALRRYRTASATSAGADAPAMPRPALPYGPALALAGLILLGDSPWFAAL